MSLTKIPYPEQIDLDSCADEPIHIIGKTQDYGILVVCDPLSLKIIQISTNTSKFLGAAYTEFLDQPLTCLLDESQVKKLKDQISRKEVTLPEEITVNGDRFMMAMHFSEFNLILDLEPLKNVENPYNFQRQLSRILGNLENASSVEELCNTAVSLTKEIMDYDRVMIYKFDEEWNGEVIAELKEDEMESWLGLHYPSTDIPRQSRELFLRTRVRMISDVSYDPVPIFPEISPLTQKPLDLSKSALRAVSPIHIEYLLNMEVGASLSAAIVIHGKLWGLIACHHRTSKFLDYYQRESAGFLAEMLATKLALQESKNFIEQTSRKHKIREALAEQMRSRPSIPETLLKGPVTLDDLVACTGTAVYFQGIWYKKGNVPAEIFLNQIRIFAEKRKEKIFFSRQLSRVIPEAIDYQKTASGILSLKMAEDKYVIWFRSEEVEQVSWGGDPSVKAFYNESEKRISPRKSFEKWTEERTGISSPWQDYDFSVVKALDETISNELLNRQRLEIEELNAKLTEANKDLKIFSYGISHDLRAPLRGIEGYLQIIMEDYGDSLGEEGFEMVGMTQDLAGKMNQLIDDILSYSDVMHHNKLKIQNIAVQPLLDELFEMFNIAVNYPQTEIVVQDDLPAIPGDRRMIFQLWSNLISNALKYSSKKEKARVEIGGSVKNGKSVFYVRDNGIGIEKDKQNKIFESFARVAGKEYKGTGIGLTIVKKILEKHRGEIWVESTIGEGTEFRFFTDPVH